MLLSETAIVGIITAVAGSSCLTQWLATRKESKLTKEEKDTLRDLSERIARREAHDEISDEADRALLFDKLARLHAETVEQGLPVSVTDKQRAENAYRVYEKLGGNGVGRHFYEELIRSHAAQPPSDTDKETT